MPSYGSRLGHSHRFTQFMGEKGGGTSYANLELLEAEVGVPLISSANR